MRDLGIGRVAGADFRNATLSPHNAQTLDFALAQWDPNIAKSLSLPPDHNDRLKRRDFRAGEYSSILKKTAPVLDLSGFQLDGLDPRGANFTGMKLVSATLRHASLEGALLNSADVAFADFTGATGLNPTQIKSANNWQVSKYDASLLQQLDLPANHNDNVNFRQFMGYHQLKLKLTSAHDVTFDADLTGSDFREFRGDLYLSGASKLDNANVAGIRLIYNIDPNLIKNATNWRLARLLPAYMAFFDKAGHGNLVYGADLSGADVKRANLRGMDLREATFKGAKFEQADLRESKFEGSDLAGAGFNKADVRWTDFRGAKNLAPEQIRAARFWRSAYYDDELRKKLGLPENHTQIVRRLETFLKDAP